MRGLSPRELEIACLVAEGLTNGEIATRLVVSITTVRTHLNNIYATMGTSSRVSLARMVLTGQLAEGVGLEVRQGLSTRLPDG